MVLLTTNSHLLSNLKLATTDVWSEAVSDQLVQSKDVASPGLDFINLAVILVNVRPENEAVGEQHHPTMRLLMDYLIRRRCTSFLSRLSRLMKSKPALLTSLLWSLDQFVGQDLGPDISGGKL